MEGDNDQIKHKLRSAKDEWDRYLCEDDPYQQKLILNVDFSIAISKSFEKAFNIISEV